MKEAIRYDSPEFSVDYANFYEGVMRDTSRGPLIEGFNESDLQKVIEDEQTKFVHVNTGNEQLRPWPLLTPITNFSEYIPDYFVRNYGSTENIFYVSIPPDTLIDPETGKKMASTFVEVASTNPNSLFVYDELDGQNKNEVVERLIEIVKPGAQILYDRFIDPKNNTPASSIHYSGVGTVKRGFENPANSLREAYNSMVLSGEVDEGARSATVLLDPSKMSETLGGGNTTVLDRLWEIYEGQFSRLIKDHPARGAQTYEEFCTMVQDRGTYTVAHFKDDDVVSFANFVSDISSCDWLNTSYFDDKFKDEFTLYFPGIATDSNKLGGRYSQNLVDLIVKLCYRSEQDIRLLFQCTNISADYIPYHIVQPIVNKTGLATMSIEGMCRYNYRGFKIH